MIPNQIDNNDVQILYSTNDLKGGYIFLEDKKGEKRIVPEVMFNKDGLPISIDKENESVQPQDKWITKCMSEVSQYDDHEGRSHMYVVMNVSRPNSVGIICDKDELKIPNDMHHEEYFY